MSSWPSAQFRFASISSVRIAILISQSDGSESSKKLEDESAKLKFELSVYEKALGGREPATVPLKETSQKSVAKEPGPSPAASVAPTVDKKVPRYCSECGNKFPLSARFCPDCGTKFRAE
jgi:hypothetical protein